MSLFLFRQPCNQFAHTENEGVPLKKTNLCRSLARSSVNTGNKRCNAANATIKAKTLYLSKFSPTEVAGGCARASGGGGSRRGARSGRAGPRRAEPRRAEPGRGPSGAPRLDIVDSPLLNTHWFWTVSCAFAAGSRYWLHLYTTVGNRLLQAHASRPSFARYNSNWICVKCSHADECALSLIRTPSAAAIFACLSKHFSWSSKSAWAVNLRYILPPVGFWLSSKMWA